MTIAETLAKLPLFVGFTQADTEQLARGAHIRSFPAGDAIVRQGDLDASMFIVTGGKAKVVLHAPGGTVEIATIGRGDVIGEISLLTGSARTATVTAIEPLTTIEIDKPNFTAVVGGRKELLEHLASVVEQRRAELDYIKQEAERADIFGHASILERLMRIFG